jgi:ABC-type multidrug transport system fused ATPase/permease subunit
MEFLDATPAIESGQARLPKGPLGFRLDAVRVTSRGSDGPSILNDCSVTVRPGEIVAMVGATGSGKSTFTALLPRLLDPTAGKLELGSERTGFLDARTLDLGELRRRVHVSTQDCFLFSDTILENVRLGAPDASDDEVRRALELAAIDDLLETLPEGIHTTIGDRGVTLSGGQRQRLALARALLARPSILVLDDSTSALDALTEQRILNNIRAFAEETGEALTLFIVASKPSTVLFADRVLVLEAGAIVAEGRHEQLVRTSASYRELLGIEDGH